MELDPQFPSLPAEERREEDKARVSLLAEAPDEQGADEAEEKD